MPSMVTPQNGQPYIVYVSLVDQANSKLFKANPTLAAGDFKVSKDGGALTDLATLPTVTPAAGRMVKISFSGAEMTGDNITMVASDAAGSEWCDLTFNIQTTARRIDDLAFPNVSGRGLGVDASGRLTMANTGTGAITAASFATDAIDANALAASAVTELQTGLATAASVPSAATIATAVWASANRTLTNFGTLAADVWGYVTRTLTMTAAQVQASVSGSDLHIVRAVTFAATLTGINFPAGWNKLYFTVKRSPGYADSEALVQIVVSNPAAGADGLLVINQEPATVAAWGSLVVAGDSVTITLADDATLLLSTGDAGAYDLKTLVDGASVLLAAGNATVAGTPTATV